MTCSFEKGKTAEFNVKGYVTAFAKEGIRGKVVSREGYFASMSFLAGAVEGLADVTRTAYAPTLELTSGIATERINSGDVARQAGVSGFGKAAEMLSDYYIKRAEQYQSVIDVPTGVEVEIVFQEGVDLTTNTSFKIKPNEIGRQMGLQMGQDMSSNDNKSNVYINNNGVF
jgi:conjugal transfer pilus assembly protein TraB